MLSYEILRIIWWGLLCVVCIGFAITDGFDMGVGGLIRVIGKTDIERRIMINSIAPHWDGNQVWLIVAGGGMFAAWPMVYAAAFSGFYGVMILVLAALFFRPVGFDYRSKIENVHWRSIWDWGIFIGSIVPPFIFGVIIGNLLQGVPFHIDKWMRITYTDSVFSLFNPFALLTGIIALCIVTMHGGAYLLLRTSGNVHIRSRVCVQTAGILVSVLFLIAAWFLIKNIDGFVLTSVIDHEAPSDPLGKTVIQVPGAWLNNYHHHPLLWLLPLMGILMPLLVSLFVRMKYYRLTFIGSAFSILSMIGTAVATLFPFVMPSSAEPNVSLTLWDGTSSQLTLQVMTIVAIITVPLILGYTVWCYYKMFTRLDEETVRKNTHFFY
ncbi:cytochrome d ubiquinol oxidase subunit II [Escherichia albertii]|uniref:cytochrome d ubiquinol oxidase subunit II n=1 Tax=Escherichia albertii TaxID=208962 RepID=UPI0010BCAF7E|nr:cytochrome d ubiquinol oxidase subunit II [Escherichia albertii]MCU7292459.1 cytochrome d ubiquinol oxidase subunit II [Escherichia albertii]MCZ8668295.1 cytochrome d ubiquinol oxidase subunit II [Escherichia albertii]QTA19297.1 cytochrome d ubiquinol oxidase subunit II [Escherichia albertii]HAX3035471.1 cytochrome d ubiquinol oxidase subunit II [Escherichia albertii]